MTEHSQETKIAILEEKVEHMMGHVKELTLRVRANEKVVASVSLLGVIACTFIGAGYFAPKAEAFPQHLEPQTQQPYPGMLLKAKCKYNIDMQKSIFIGDKLTDMIAGEKAKLGKLIYFNQNKVQEYTTIDNHYEIKKLI